MEKQEKKSEDKVEPPNLGPLIILLSILMCILVISTSPTFKVGACVRLKDSKSDPRPTCKILALEDNVYTYDCHSNKLTEDRVVLEAEFELTPCLEGKL